MPTGEEKRVPVDSENLRPRLHALPEPGRRSEERGREAVDSVTDSRRRRKPQGRVEGYRRDGAGPDRRRRPRASTPTSTSRSGPAGKGAPRIDPKPILDGWKLLEATAIYRAKGKSPFAEKLGGAGVLLLSKEALQRRVLADEQIELPECDRLEVRAGQIDRRLLAALAYLSEQGFRLTITSMLCGRTAASPPAATSPTTTSATRPTSPRSTACRCSATRARAR